MLRCAGSRLVLAALLLVLGLEEAPLPSLAACSSATYSGPFTFTTDTDGLGLTGYTLHLAKDGGNLCVRAQVASTAGWVAFAKAATPQKMNGAEASFYQISTPPSAKDVVLGNRFCAGCPTSAAASTEFNITEVNATAAGGVFTFEFARSDGINMTGSNDMLGAWRAGSGTIESNHAPTTRGAFCVDLDGAAPRVCQQACPCPGINATNATTGDPTTGVAGVVTTGVATTGAATTGGSTTAAATTTGEPETDDSSSSPELPLSALIIGIIGLIILIIAIGAAIFFFVMWQREKGRGKVEDMKLDEMSSD